MRDLVLVLIALFFLVPRLAGIWVDYIWFDAVGYLSVFTKILSTKIVLALIGFFSAFGFIWLAIRLTGRNLDKEDLEIEPGFKVASAIPFIVGVISAFAVSGAWMVYLKFANAASFGRLDPVFAKDIGFYFFQLPFYELLTNYILILSLTSLFVAGGIYLFLYQKRMMKEDEDEQEIVSIARKGLSPLTALLFFILSVRIYLAKYSILFSGRGAVFGAAYADIHVMLPVILILSGLSLVVGVLVLYGGRTDKMSYSLLGLGTLVLVAIIGSGAVALVQSYQVEPNEYNLEKPYIERNINHTLRAYDLSDVDEREFSAGYNLSYSDLEEENRTVKNIRLWDWRALKDTYSQIQLIRTYYDFNDVDIDRYRFNGDYEQVMLSAREMDQSQLSGGAKTWTNEHLVYTHGSGVVMSPAGKVSEGGMPILYLKDIPTQTTKSAPNPETIQVENPDIYYGEMTDNFVVTDTTTKEFDYPQGGENVFDVYGGEGGVELDLLNKLALAMNLGDLRLLVSSSLKPDSKMLFRRNIAERTGRIAPFLDYDSDPYAVIHDKRVFWLYDAYTKSSRYPYSEPSQDFNYIRNSVKVSVDAYNGDVNYYMIDDDDPLIRTYQNIFPELFQDFSEMPENLKNHIRYPQNLFSVQAQIYSTYHMKDPNVFYNQEDKWEIPEELYKGRSQKMDPYYITIQIPDENRTQFVLMMPFIPEGKNNMISWLGAKSDTPEYGEKVLFSFSKQKLIYGPSQIESRIDQNTEISQQFTLWSQSGSNVIRGNLLVIPVKDSLLYVEPVFLRSSGESIPELKRVIVAFGDEIAMEPTLEGSLEKIFTGEGEEEEEPTDETRDLLKEAKDHYQRAQSYLKAGNFSAYAREIDSLGAVLEKME